jgi:hypothetical protein
MARKLLKNGFLAIVLGCRSIKNFLDDVVLLVFLNSCFIEATESTTLFLMNNCRNKIKLFPGSDSAAHE